MSYRRPAQASQQCKQWMAFTQHNRALFDRAGVPGLMAEDRRHFDYFLGHGYSMNDDGFALDSLGLEQRAALRSLVEAYLASGLDPGWGVEPGVKRLIGYSGGSDTGVDRYRRG